MDKKILLLQVKYDADVVCDDYIMDVIDRIDGVDEVIN